MSRIVQVVGPAYLDRVVRVDGPLTGPADGGPLDGSVDGGWVAEPEDGDDLTIDDGRQNRLDVRLPSDWTGPRGRVLAKGRLGAGTRVVRATEGCDDLGGMGAGFAKALGGILLSALGPESDVMSRLIASQLASEGIVHRPLRVDHPADWTLLISSGPFGDKLPIGFRGCHAALSEADLRIDGPADLVVVASLPNRLASAALRSARGAVRVFAPAMRNMLDRDVPVAEFRDAFDLLCCNRGEWESLAIREQVAEIVPVMAITDGPSGARIVARAVDGVRHEFAVPVFPRDRPPRDTNRAGEAFASTLVTALLDAGWSGGPIEPGIIPGAARRASAAAALVLDREDFGFPAKVEIDAVLRAGRVVG